MLASISAHELAEWRAYYDLEPWGEERGDLRVAILTALTANLNRKKGSAPFKVREFMPDFSRRDGTREAMSDETLEAMWKELATASMGQPQIVGPDGRPASSSS